MNQTWIEDLAHQYPRIKWPLRLIGKWPILLLYIGAEVWGVVILSFFFWQTMNVYTDKKTAKRLYPTLGLCSGLNPIFANRTIRIIKNCEYFTLYIMIILILVSFLIMWCYYWLARNNEQINPSYMNEPKLCLNLMESIRMIVVSKEIFYIFLLVLGYGVCGNMIEGIWKHAALLRGKGQYMEFFGSILEALSLTYIVVVVISRILLDKFSWFCTACLTPIVFLFTGLPMFILLMCHNILNKSFTLDLAVYFGKIFTIFAHSVKYAAFDTTRDIAYMQLDSEIKNKGKAAVDMIGGRFSKSLGSFIQSSIFILFPNIEFQDLAGCLCIIFVILCIIWLIGVYKLDNELLSPKIIK